MKKSIFLLILLFSMSCAVEKESTSPDLFEFQEKLKTSLEKCGSFAHSVNESINKAESELENQWKEIKDEEDLEITEYKKIRNKWDKSSLEIANEITSLSSEYDQVYNISQLYFRRMDEIVSQLQDASDYEEVLEKSQTKKTEFNNELEKARAAIEEIKKTQEDIKNFDKVLELHATFGNIDKQIDRLKAITIRAKNVTKDLIEFSKTGNQIVNAKTNRNI